MLDKREEELTTVLVLIEDIPENKNINSMKIRTKHMLFIQYRLLVVLNTWAIAAIETIVKNNVTNIVLPTNMPNRNQQPNCSSVKVSKILLN